MLNRLAETTIGTIQDPCTNAIVSIFNAATLLSPIMRIGTGKRESLAADAPAETAVKREVARAVLLVVSSVKSSGLSDGLENARIKKTDKITEVSRLANAPAQGQ